MKIKFTFLLFLIISNSFSQQLRILNDSIFNFELKQKTDKIDNFIIIRTFNYQSLEVVNEEDPSQDKHVDYEEFIKYLFWEAGNKIYIQKFDNYGEYNTVEIINPKIFKFLSENITKINKEKVRNYITKSKTEKGKIIYEYVVAPGIGFKEFYINSSGKVKYITYNEFDLTNENNENINYKKNSRLKIIELQKICEKEILGLEKDNKFILK